jgi:mono/diheme cytochrome c family protein
MKPLIFKTPHTLAKLLFLFILLTGIGFLPAAMAQKPPVEMNGKILFKKNCTGCHGYDGTKGAYGAKNLRKSKLDNEALVKAISNGNWIMPKWKKRLSPGQIQAIADYIKTFRD